MMRAQYARMRAQYARMRAQYARMRARYARTQAQCAWVRSVVRDDLEDEMGQVVGSDPLKDGLTMGVSCLRIQF